MSLSGVVKGHQAKHSSTTKPQCQSKSERAYAEIVSQLRKRGPKEIRLEVTDTALTQGPVYSQCP